ncbi:MAG: PQQ-like beta-propeller repeat protein [Candidatus Omnitrophica bacterium]|nr:PQQ-like beta-propeller repeat protein [Candidatus Omnitrophota bacterium]
MKNERCAQLSKSICRFAAGFAAGGFLIGTTALRGADWPQYRGPDHDGVSTDKILDSWPVDGPRKLWQVPLTDGFSSFAIGQGKAFTLVARTIDGQKQEVCVALDLDSGKELWAAPLGQAKYEGGGDEGAPDNRGGDGPRSTPTIDGDRIYTLSAYLVLTCFEANTGKVIWSRDLLKEYGGKIITWENAASPLIDGDLIFVNCNAPNQTLLGLHKEDGSLAWKGQNDSMTQATPIAATILGVRQVLFFTQSGLVSVAPQTGDVLWRYKFPYNVSTASSPVVAGDIVYCSAGYGVGSGAVRITKSGDQFLATEIWRIPGNKFCNHWSTPVYSNGYLYGLFGFKEHGKCPLKCLDIATGKEMWSHPGFGPGGTLLVDGKVLVLGDKGQLALVAATPKEYIEEARCQAVSGKCWNSPAISNGKLYARSTKEGVCLDLSAELMAK